jgi:tryptophan synthase alpha chain
VLVADVPAFEAEPFGAAARSAGVEPVLIAAANTPAPTLARIAALGGGYTYCVARAGVTGADESVRFDHREMIAELARAGAPPPVFGFGISRPDHVRAAREAGAAGVISGSAIVQLAASCGATAPLHVQAFVTQMKAATRAKVAA